MDTLDAMRMFAMAVRHESFSEAGRRLGVAPSSVSRQMTALEEHLGVRLLNRTTRRLSLTEAGEVYFERARRIVEDVDETNREVRELNAAPRGVLRVNASVAFGRLYVAPAIPEFLSLYPELRMEFTTSDQVIDLVEEGVDVAIRIAVLEDSSLVARRLAPMRRVICASPAYLEAHGVPARPEDLERHNCLTFRFHASSNLWRPSGRSWILKAGDSTVEVKVGGSLFSNNSDALVTAARGGLGLVLMPEWSVNEDILAGTLVRVLDDYVVSPTEKDPAIYAVYPSRRYLSAKVRAFVNFMVDRLGHLDAKQQPSTSSAA